jgi:hypothetical protein
MGSANRLKLGLFGANCSSGRAVTMVPERRSGSWPDCVRIIAAQFARELYTKRSSHSRKHFDLRTHISMAVEKRGLPTSSAWR